MVSETASVNFGLLGYGYWGQNYARVLSETPEATLSVICDEDAERLRRAASRFPRVQVCGTAGELMGREDVDTVVVSTPASTHYELARLALRCGKHVIVEKPLALEVSHCEELKELAGRSRRILMVAHTFLYNAGIQKMHECVRAPDFGRVYYMHSTRTNLGPIRRDVNAVWDLAAHDISIFNYLLEEQPIWASATGTRVLSGTREDVGFITLGYTNEVIGNIHVSWADPNKVREVVVVGSRQRLVFDDLNDMERVRIFERGVSVGEKEAGTFGEFKLLMRDGDIISPKIPFSEPLRNQINNFLAAALHGQKLTSDADTGVHVVEALKAIDASIRERGRAVEVSTCKLVSRSN